MFDVKVEGVSPSKLYGPPALMPLLAARPLSVASVDGVSTVKVALAAVPRLPLAS